ncbi:hypothetical protein GCM10023187_11960 [Nibrella viscosa]|uniref:DUF4926 domain-containing protein n=1 Tax=Nibrella viscosa TaxID=1084524 RepID=A0ABP8K2K6_9BACT
MKFELYTRVVLARDFPEYHLKKGDSGIVVERVEITGQEVGYILEIFDAQGNTVEVIPVVESDLEAPRKNTVLTFRELNEVA